MKKKDLAKLALMGLASGLMVGCQPAQGEMQKESAMEMGEMTQQEKDFYDKLNADGKKAFSQMSKDDRAMAMQAASKGSTPNDAVMMASKKPMK